MAFLFGGAPCATPDKRLLTIRLTSILPARTFGVNYGDMANAILEWPEAVNLLKPYVFEISTPDGRGTGFLVSHSTLAPIIAIATANHVVSHAHEWQQPIRVKHHLSGKSLLLLPNEDWAVLSNEGNDTAAVILNKGELPIDNNAPELILEKRLVKVGSEIGWLGFPAVSPASTLCFFSGHISAQIGEHGTKSYLVDGVAINGVSGGPAFYIPRSNDRVVIIGVVSAYIANRATGDTLPGVSVVRDVFQFQQLVSAMHSVDEAQTKAHDKLRAQNQNVAEAGPPVPDEDK